MSYDALTGCFYWRVNKARAKANDIAGYLGGYGYWRIKIDGFKYMAHRLAFLYMEGAFPGAEVDHIDGNRSNNAWHNLRHATRKQNQENKYEGPMRGISPTKSGKWVVRIKHAQKHMNLGTYSTLEEAQRVRKEVERALFTHSLACSIPRENP